MYRKLRYFLDQEENDELVAEFNRYDREIPVSLSREMLWCWVMDTIVHCANHTVAEVPWTWPQLGDYIPESIVDEIERHCDNVALEMHADRIHAEYVEEYNTMLANIRTALMGLTRCASAKITLESILSILEDYKARSVRLAEINFQLAKLVLEINT